MVTDLLTPARPEPESGCPWAAIRRVLLQSIAATCMALLISLAMAGNAFAAAGGWKEAPAGFANAEGTEVYFYEGTPENVRADILSAYKLLPESILHEISISDFHYLVLPTAKAAAVPGYQDLGTSRTAGQTMGFSYTVYADGKVEHTNIACVILYDNTWGTTPGNVLLHETGHMLHDCMLIYRGRDYPSEEGFITKSVKPLPSGMGI